MVVYHVGQVMIYLITADVCPNIVTKLVVMANVRSVTHVSSSLLKDSVKHEIVSSSQSKTGRVTAVTVDSNSWTMHA